MSRSLGDLVAASVGVSAEPGKILLIIFSKFIFIEFYEHELVEEDKFIIIGSDGIWEFISNEEVIYTNNINIIIYRLLIL